MVDKTRFSPECLALLRTAKRYAIADTSAEIEAHHLVRACAQDAPRLVVETLVAAGLAATDAESFRARLAASLPAGPESQEGKRFSASASVLLDCADRLAAEHPLADETPIGVPHLWACVCADATACDLWLREQGLPETAVSALSVAAESQLPARRTAAPSRLKEAERAVLERFCHRQLTALARAGRLSPAYGMDAVHEQMARCLLKRDKRSLVLTGPAGVGKTKLVEDLALRIVNGEVPELAGCQVYELDLAQFTRGTHYAGSRAERWAQLTEVLRAHPDEVILFIDELHTIIGVAIEGQAMDLANALKPLMVDAKVRIIGATTSDEYRRHIDGDPALARRFTEIKVPEPDRDTMLRLLAEVAPLYGKHHRVQFDEEALEAIYDLAQTYFPNQAFPAKGVDLLDEVGVQVRLANRASPPETRPEVRREDVRYTLQRVWGIEPQTLAVDLGALMKARVVGQDHAVERLADQVLTASLRYGREQRAPRATILFLGPPGVGKSYLAQVLSDTLFPGRRTLLTLDMTEFSGGHAGEHARWRLLGPPPPYVGWENGGLLTSHALQNPVSVVLVDEFDKAEPEARNILLRILNDGEIQDGRGRLVSFRGIYFILTANAARSLWQQVSRSIGFVLDTPSLQPGADYSDEQIRAALGQEGFSPELLSRISHFVLFNVLSHEDLVRIAGLLLEERREAALIEDMVLLDYDPAALAAWLVDHAYPRGDVRALRSAYERYLETPIARWRWQSQGEARPALLRLELQEEAVTLHPETRASIGERIDHELFARLASAYSDRADRERRLRATRARFGT